MSMKNLIKLVLCLLAIFCGSILTSAATTTTIYGSTYTVDTLQSSIVGPGTTYTAIKFHSDVTGYTFRTFYLIVDVDNPKCAFKVEHGQDSIIGCETIRRHADRRTTATNKFYFAGVNGDFYQTSGEIGTPIFGTVVDGQMSTPPIDANPEFVITDYRTPWCTGMTPSLSMKVNGGTSASISHVNGARGDNELVLYNSNIGKFTHTATGGVEIAVQLAAGETWKINSPVKVQVIGTSVTTGNMAIPSGQAVLSASGTRMSEVQALKAGDEIELNLGFSMYHQGNITPNVTSMVGGNVLLVANGEVLPQGDMARHPRTMMGYTKDQKKMILCVVDGRSTISSGGIYLELADLMRYAGAYWAMNCDGGGSSTMYVRNLGIMNVPSDGSERAVSNGLYLVLDAPEDNAIAEIRFVDWAMKFPKYGTYVSKFYGYNQYGMLIDTDVQGVTLSCPEELGHIKGGNTFVGDGSGTYALTATLNGKTATIPVTIVQAEEVKMRNSDVLNDTFRDYAVEVQGKMGEGYLPLDPAALTWSSNDEDVVKINSQSGILRGVADGSAVITGKVGSFTGTMNVKVEKPTKHALPIETAPDPTTWKISQTGGKDIIQTTVGDGFNLKYTGNGVSRGANIKLVKEVLLWSLPDAIRLRVNPHSAPLKTATFAMRTNQGILGTKAATALTDVSTDKETVFELKTSDWCDAQDIANFPIKFEYLQMAMGTSTSGTEYQMDINGIEGIYNAIPESSGINAVKSDQLCLMTNPISEGENAIAKVNIQGKVIMKVADMSGRRVLDKEFESATTTLTLPTSTLTQGYYLVTLINGGLRATCKLIVK